VFNICQQVRTRCVAGLRWRVLNEGVDLLGHLIAMLELNQGVSVHFDNGIRMRKTRVESGEMEVYVRKSVKLVARRIRCRVSIVPNQGMTSLVPTF
jgi:hypothetical protein